MGVIMSLLFWVFLVVWVVFTGRGCYQRKAVTVSEVALTVMLVLLGLMVFALPVQLTLK
jgi:hypothetical protein